MSDPRHDPSHEVHEHPIDFSDDEVRKAHEARDPKHPVYAAYLKRHGPLEIPKQHACPDCFDCAECGATIHANAIGYHAEGCSARAVLAPVTTTPVVLDVLAGIADK